MTRCNKNKSRRNKTKRAAAKNKSNQKAVQQICRFAFAEGLTAPRASVQAPAHDPENWFSRRIMRRKR
jgi:hypothetical protein